MKNKGITLIALVITIIILLILVGVSVAMLTGENGILIKADRSTKETEIAEAKEQAKLDIAEWTTEQLKAGKSSSLDDQEIQKILTGKTYVGSAEADKFTTQKNGYEILYSDLYSTNAGGSQKPGESDTEETVTPGVLVTGSNKTYTKNGTAVIPVGFKIEEGLDDIEEGLVITDEAENEFVWIPVTDENNYKRNQTYPDKTVSKAVVDDTDYLPNGVANEKEAVLQAGGFYIARYETSQENGKAVSKKNKDPWSNMYQKDAKVRAKTLVNTDFVKSALISGTQWDVTMEFIDGKKDGTGGVFNVTTRSNSRHPINGKPTGQNIADKVCNIYDLEGNSWEFNAEKPTKDASEYDGVIRGGRNFSYDTDMACSRSSNISALNWITFRCVLYVINDE